MRQLSYPNISSAALLASITVLAKFTAIAASGMHVRRARTSRPSMTVDIGAPLWV
jgi:hypothetical protein